MGQAAQPWADRIERIGRAGFWRTIKETLSLRGWAGRSPNGAYYGGARQRWRSCALFSLSPMTAFLFALAWKAFLPALLVVALVDVLTQSQPQRIRRLHRTGLSQRSIASRLGVSRHQVRLALA
jgi:hypothetical protein